MSALAGDAAVRGVLLASAHPKVFCPGLDLVGLIDYDRPAMERFMLRFAEATWALYGLSKPVLAAVGGHAVAGGCILFGTTKIYLRADALRAMQAHEQERLSEFLDGWFSEPTRRRLREMVDGLSRPRG